MLGCQKSEADLARRERNIRVGYARREMDRGRGERVIWWDDDAKVPKAACGGSFIISMVELRPRSDNAIWHDIAYKHTFVRGSIYAF